ncbi:S41 family peptidase [Stenotrophomonas sp. CFBP8994]|uniref:S41 family peptidase n=1 Tax=Stenotrophomonas sp. CFBP8994 TaxID=3096527 RepID=UPI002A6AFA03|nr:S41 family peptidase [Stenotrophomonas sp. CFBP8994]MDY0980348.1 S41 family peptidase [Stenotrophomonas sp. CFBP8994]
MAKAKGLAVLLTTTALTAACIFPTRAAPAPPTPDTPDVRETILQLLEQRALHSDQIDWPAAHQQLKQARSTDEADRIVTDLISRSTANHGRWRRAQSAPSVAGERPRTADTEQRRQLDTQAGAPGLQRKPADPKDPIGSIRVPPFMDKPSAPREIKHQRRQAFARMLQSWLRSEDQRNLCGWIVDLRENRGGNMWPMLAGIAPLLSTDPKHREVIGAFVRGAEHQTWSIESGRVLLGERSPMSLDSASYVLRHPAPPVAVLIGPRTASSGEAVALAFRGRPATRSFGQKTSGYSTANVPTPLPDGSTLSLTVSVSVDRNLKGDGGKLEPDFTIEDGVEAESAARSWLMAQPACRGVAKAP